MQKEVKNSPFCPTSHSSLKFKNSAALYASSILFSFQTKREILKFGEWVAVLKVKLWQPEFVYLGANSLYSILTEAGADSQILDVVR